MKPEQPSSIGKYLAICLGVLTVVGAPLARAADDTDAQKLQDENATLRQQVADLEARLNQTAPAATTTTTTTTTAGGTTAPIATTTNPEVTVLTPFDVSTDKDYGYLKTNSISGTHFDEPIQEIPMYMQVLSSDFIKDTNIQNISDLFRYMATGAGDENFVSDRPTNSSTAQGQFTIRGFSVNAIERNGNLASAFSDFNFDNVDRVEVIQGSASIFYGASYPGGVINIITKQPQFGKIPTTIDFTFGQNNMRKAIFDTNQSWGDKAAFRVVGGWENADFQKQYEYDKHFDITPTLTVVPFKSGKLKITAEDSYLKETSNYNCNGWDYPDGWFNAYQNPSNALMQAGGINTTTAGAVAAYQARILNSEGNYGNDLRSAAGNYALPDLVNGALSPYAYYNGLAGQRIRDTKFNYHNRGAFVDNDDNMSDFTVSASPTDWLDLHYQYTRSAELFNDKEANNLPNADGYTYIADSSVNESGYYNHADNHQFDAVGSFEKWGIKDKLFGGFIFEKSMIQYQGNGSPLNYATTPGATNALGNPNNAYVPVANQIPGLVPVGQLLYSRTGQVLTVAQVYSNWDPAFNQQPDSAVLVPEDRTDLDGYPAQFNEWYWMDQLSALHDRLHFTYGYRLSEIRNSGQWGTNNFPYFAPGPDAWANNAQFPPAAFGYGNSYEESYGMFTKPHGSSFQWGLAYDFTKEITGYAQFSKTFKFNSYLRDGEVDGPLDEPNIFQAALSYGGGSFMYRGQTVTSVAQGEAILNALGGNDPDSNETGYNYEAGVKTSLWDGKLSGTFAVFRGTRTNIATDDYIAQAAEPFNSTTPGINSTTLFPVGSSYYNVNNMRWRTVGSEILVQGAELESIITPMRNYQIVLNVGYLPQAHLVSSPIYNAAYAAASVTNAVAYGILYNARATNVPKETLSIWNHYTIDSGILRGLALSLGAQYESERVYSQSVAANPLNGGLMLPAYWVFNSSISYPYQLLGYNFSTQVGLYNLTNVSYWDGESLTPAEHFNWIVDTTLSF